MLSIYYKGWKDLSKLQKMDEFHVINWMINEWKQIASQLSDEKGVHKFMYIFSVHIYRKPTIRRRKENQKEKFRRIFQHNHQRNSADRIHYKPDILPWKISRQFGQCSVLNSHWSRFNDARFSLVERSILHSVASPINKFHKETARSKQKDPKCLWVDVLYGALMSEGYKCYNGRLKNGF